MTDSKEFTISRTFNAPRDLVWKAWSDPASFGQWWGPRGFTTTTYEMDVRPGGVWRLVMHGPDGKNYPNESYFQEIHPPAIQRGADENCA